MRQVLNDVLVLLVMMGCAPPLLAVMAGCAQPLPDDDIGPSSEDLLGGATLINVLQGLDTFNHEEFDGNGRTCASCHTTVERAADIGYRWGQLHGQSNLQALLTSAQFVDRHATGDLSPEFAQLVFEVDPTDGLFRDVDSELGVGANFSHTLFRGLVRVHITLHPSVHVQDCGPANECEVLPNGQHRIVVLRSPPTVFNTILQEDSRPGRTPGLMWDMREDQRLGFQGEAEPQARDALDSHFGTHRAGTNAELFNIAAFERNRFTDLASASYAATDIDPGLPTCTTASECRGREFFLPQHISASDMAHRGLCSQCHSGPLLNHSSIYHKFQFPRAPLADGTCPCSDGSLPGADGRCARSVRMEGPIDPPHAFDPPGVDSPPLCFHRVSAPGPEIAEAGMVVRTFMYDSVPSATDPPGVMINGVQVSLAPPGLPWGPRTFVAHDPGRGGLTGDPCNEFPLLCLFAPPGQVLGHNFRIASLRGAGRRLHFDHNNVDMTPEDQCRDVFRGLASQVSFFQAIGDPDAAAFATTEQDVADCAAYLRLL